jgi:hypothetical protein
MTWEAWVLLVWFAFNLIVNVAFVGRSIKLTPSGAVFSMINYTFLGWCVLRLADVL